MQNCTKSLLMGVSLLFSISVFAADLTVPMAFVAKDGEGTSAGKVVIKETKYGLLFEPELRGLTPGIHGFHIHQNPSCADNGMAAGGHWVTSTSQEKHLGPYNDSGHEGDLPVLIVSQDGTATLPVLAPRLKELNEIKDHALMVHAGGDNYSDVPDKVGGGGARMVCGVIK